MATYKIPDLDKKVAFVVGHCEFQRILDYTKQRAIAEQLCVSPPQWPQMKKGLEAIE